MIDLFKKDIFYSSVRNYSSALEAAVDEDNIPVSVYESLIEAVHKKINLLHGYVALRRKSWDWTKSTLTIYTLPLFLTLKWKKLMKKQRKEFLKVLLPWETNIFPT